MQSSHASTRDRLAKLHEASLLGMLACGYFALVGSGSLDAPFLTLTGAALLFRALQLAGFLKWRVPETGANAGTVAYLLFYPVDYKFLSRDFITATVHLVLFVTAARLVTASTRRDLTLLKVVAFLELLAAALVSESWSYLAFLLLFLLAAVATFSTGEMVREWDMKRRVADGGVRLVRNISPLVGTAAAAILVLTITLFLVLPRTARAALDRFGPVNRSVSGLASEVTLGQVGEVQRSSAAVLRYRHEGKQEPPLGKLRGDSLGEFNGWKWYNSVRAGKAVRGEAGQFQLGSDDEIRRVGRRASYEVVGLGLTSDLLFLAGTPEHVRVARELIWQTPTGAYRLPWTGADGLRYAAVSRIGARGKSDGGTQTRLDNDTRNFYLRLPPVDQRIMQMAREVTGGHTTDAHRASAIETFLRTKYAYSLEPLEREPEDPLALFLLDRKKGHCEYFASAMAVMLRLQWIPSRVVTGFQAGTLNSMSGWWMVRGSDAHSWVEAWIPGEGWVEYDPTPGDTSGRSFGLLERAGMFLDAVDVWWQDWVLGYNLERQVELALEVGRSGKSMRFGGGEKILRDWQRALRVPGEPGSWLNWMIGALLIGVFAWSLRRRWLPGLFRWQRAKLANQGGGAASLRYTKMLADLQRKGYRKRDDETPGEFAATIPALSLRQHVAAFTDCYYEQRFGGKNRSLETMDRLLAEIRNWKEAGESL